MNKTTIGIIVVVVLLLIGGWYYFSYQTPPIQMGAQNAGTTDTNTLPASNATTTGDTGIVTAGATVTAGTAHEDDIAVSGFNFGFTPSTITVKKGDHVKITFTNSGGMHDFKIDEFNVATERLETGDTATVEFDATKTGTFQYYCSVGNHRAMGMWGTLTVTQ